MASTDIRRQRVLIIEDEATQRRILLEHLKALEFDVVAVVNGIDGIESWKQDPRIRIVVTDLGMAKADDFEVIKKIRQGNTRETYVMVLASHDNKNYLAQALSMGADDFINKPLDGQELALRMEAAKHLLRLKDQNKLVFKIAELAAARSGEVDLHLKRTTAYCYLIADDLRKNSPGLGLTKETAEDVAQISVLHDIGKMFIPDGLLNKRGQYTSKEYEMIKEHTTLGAGILKKLYEDTGSPFLLLGYEMALGHHERWDGGGYPRGLKGDAIPIEARIMAFADAFDAILSRRPYKDALPPVHADAMILSEKGRQFDPIVVESYERNKEEFVEIHDKYPELSRNNPF